MRSERERKRTIIKSQYGHAGAHQVLLIHDQHLHTFEADNLLRAVVQQMADDGVPSSIDRLEDLQTGIRLAVGHPHALARYDAVVILTTRGRLA